MHRRTAECCGSQDRVEKMDGARFSQNDVLQMEVIALVKLFVRYLKLIHEV